MFDSPNTTKRWNWVEGEIITVDFDRPVDFDPNKYPELTNIGRWMKSNDSSKYFLVNRIRAEFPDVTINRVLSQLNLNGYELVHQHMPDTQVSQDVEVVTIR